MIKKLTLTSLLGCLGIFRKFLGNQIFLVFLLSFLASVLEGFGIMLIVPFLPAFFASGTLANLSSDVVGETTFFGDFEMFSNFIADFSVWGIASIIFLLFLCKSIVIFGSESYGAFLRSKLQKKVRCGLFEGYTNLKYESYLSRSAGLTTDVIMTQTSQLIGTYNGLNSLVQAIIQAVLYVCISLVLSWQFTAIAIVAGALYVFAFKWVTAFITRLSFEFASTSGSLSRMLVQSLGSMKYLVATSQAGLVAKHVEKTVLIMTRNAFIKTVLGSFITNIREPIALLFFGLIIYFQALLIQLEPHILVMALLVFYRLFTRIVGIQSRWNSLASSYGGANRVVEEMLDLKTNFQSEGKRKCSDFRSRFKFEDVSFSYPNSVFKVLDGLSMTIEANSTVALIGRSGAGKSTIADMLTLSLTPTKGRIWFDDVVSTEVNRLDWGGSVGYVCQETTLFDDTIGNNICMWSGDYKQDPELLNKIKFAAKKAYIWDYINSLPCGLDTRVGDRGANLSGGQRQRVFIARELFRNPKVLILDEATSALDSESENAIRQSISGLHGEITLILISHRLSTVRNADQILVIDQGRCVNHGTYTELMENKESLFYSLAARQMESDD